MFGAAANEQLCEHTFRVGAESLFRSVGAEILEAARRPDVDEAPDAAPDAGGGAEGARGAAPKRPSTCYSRMKVFDAPPAPRVADTVLWALSCDGEFRSLRPVLAAALGLHEEGVTPQSVLWCVGRAGMQELLSILPKVCRSTGRILPWGMGLSVGLLWDRDYGRRPFSGGNRWRLPSRRRRLEGTATFGVVSGIEGFSPPPPPCGWGGVMCVLCVRYL